MRGATLSRETSHRPRGGTASTRPLLRASSRAHGQGLPRTRAPGRQGCEAALAALRLALRHQEALEPLGPLPEAVPLQHGPSCGAGGTGHHSARRGGIAQALGTTRAGPLALGPVLARGLAPGARLSAGRRALAPAAWAVLG